MFKKLLSLSLLLCGLSGTTQNLPTINSYTVDTLCDGDFIAKFLTITIEDLDGDSTYIDPFLITTTNGFIDYQVGFTVVEPAYSPGATLRTFEIYGSANFGLPSGVNIESVNIDVAGNVTNDGSTAILNVPDVPVYGMIDVSFTQNPIYVCSNAQLIDLTQFAVNPSGEWAWANEAWQSSDNYSVTNAFSPKTAYKVFNDEGASGYFLEYTITNSAGCSNYSNAEVLFDIAPTIAMVTSPSTCLGATGGASATITGTSPYNVNWTNGFSESLTGIPVSQISNVSSGVYYINVKDANGCKSVGKANISDADFTVTETISAVLCAGVPGTIDLSIGLATGSVSSIFWSNGQTTSTLNAPAGEYSVEIHSSSNCNYFGTFEIPDSALNVDLNTAWGNSQCFSSPDGIIDITTFGGTGSYTWNWTKNMSPFSSMEDLNNIEGGVYECTVMDVGSSCSLTWSKTIENYNNVFLYVDKLKKSTCGNNDGEIDIMVDTIWGEIPTFYQWSSGTTGEDLIGVPSGDYTLTYTDQTGCTNYLTVNVKNEKPYQPQVCLLTVDSSLTYNQIVWEKVPGMNISGFNVYRETSTFGNFEKVSERPYALESFFMDNAASPIDRSWRYNITTYDACGGESYPSFIHKTIHTVANSTNGTDFTITWDDYEGINYSSVDLKRFDDTNGWQVIGTYAPGANSAPDTPPVLSGLDYIVSFNLSQTCQSTKATDYNSSRSNRTTSAFNPGGSTLELDDELIGEIKIYPNPARSIVTVFVENPELFELIVLSDINGKIINSTIISDTNSFVDMEELSNGIYLISLVSDDKVINHKVIKE